MLPSPVAAPPFGPLPGLGSARLPGVGLPLPGLPLPGLPLPDTGLAGVALPPLGAPSGLPGQLLERVGDFLAGMLPGPGSSLPAPGSLLPTPAALPGSPGPPDGAAAAGPGAGPPEQRDLLLAVLRPIALAVAGEPPLLLEMLQSRAGAQLAARMLTDLGATVPGLLPAVRTAALQALAGGSSRDRAAAARLGQVLGALSSRSPHFLDTLSAPEAVSPTSGAALLAGLERAIGRRPSRGPILGERLATGRPELAPLAARWLLARGTEPSPLWPAALAGLQHSPRFAVPFLAALAGDGPSQVQGMWRVLEASPRRAGVVATALGEALAAPPSAALRLPETAAGALGQFIGERRDLAERVAAGAARAAQPGSRPASVSPLLWSLPLPPLAKAAARSLALREMLDRQLLSLARKPQHLARWVRERPEALPRALERLPSLALPLVQTGEGRRALAAVPRAAGALARALPRLAGTPLGRELSAPGNAPLQLLLARGAGALSEVAGGTVSGGLLGLIRRPSLAQGITREWGRGIRQATGRWPKGTPGSAAADLLAPAASPRRQRGLLPAGVSGSQPGAAPPPSPAPSLIRAPHLPSHASAHRMQPSVPGSPRGRLPVPPVHLPGVVRRKDVAEARRLQESAVDLRSARHTSIRTPHRPKLLSPPSPAAPAAPGFHPVSLAGPGPLHASARLAASPAPRLGKPATPPPTAAALHRPAPPPTSMARAAPPVGPSGSGSPGSGPPDGARGAASLRHVLVQQEGAGQRIPPEHRSPMEQFFGRPIEDVRLHTGPIVARTARALRADAFTIGRDIFFGRGKLSLGTQVGQALLAHELTHVVQQSTLGQRLHGYGAAPQTLEQEARQVERVFRAHNVGTESAGLCVGRYQRTYVNMGQAPLTPDVEGRLEHISLLALEVCERLLLVDARFRVERHTLSRLDIELDLDLARLSDAEAAEAWGQALAQAVQERLAAGAGRPAGQGEQVRLQRAGFGELRVAEGRMAAEEARARADSAKETRAAPDPRGPTIQIEGWSLSADPTYVRHKFGEIAAKEGFNAAYRITQLFWQRYRWVGGRWKSYQDLVQRSIEEGFQLNARMEGEFGFQPGEGAKLQTEFPVWQALTSFIDSEFKAFGAEYHKFVTDFQPKAESVTRKVLEESRKLVVAEASRYGLAYGSPKMGSKRRVPHKLTDYEPHRKESEAMGQAAGDLYRARSAYLALLQDLYLNPTQPATDLEGYKKKQAEFKAKEREFNEKRARYERLYPILVAFTSRDRWEELPKISLGPTPRPGQETTFMAELVGDEAEEKFDNIRKAEKALEAGKFNVWKFPEIVQLTLVEEGLSQDAIKSGWAMTHIDTLASIERFKDILWNALAIGLAILAAIPSGGSSLVALGTGAAATGGAVISVNQAFKHLQEYQLQKAATGTHFDKAQAISSQEPSLFWLAFDIVAAVADVGGAFKAFRAFARFRKQAAAGGVTPGMRSDLLREVDNLPADEAARLLKKVEDDALKAAPTAPTGAAPTRATDVPAGGGAGHSGSGSATGGPTGGTGGGRGGGGDGGTGGGGGGAGGGGDTPPGGTGAPSGTPASSSISAANLRAQRTLEETLSSGKFVVEGRPLELGSHRIAVFDLKEGRMLVGGPGAGTHIGVVERAKLPFDEGRFVGGFIDVSKRGKITFSAVSGTFPHTASDLPRNVLDHIRGLKITVRTN
jgi:uncharacterized protein DUF4157